MFFSLIALTACKSEETKQTSTSSTSMPSLSGQLPTDKVQSKEKAEAASNLSLKTYIEKVKPQLTDIQSQVAESYSDISLTQDDAHSMTITYTFAIQYTLSEADLTTVKDNFKDLNSSIYKGMTTAKVTNPSLHLVFKLPDGTVVIDEPYTE